MTDNTVHQKCQVFSPEGFEQAARVLLFCGPPAQGGVTPSGWDDDRHRPVTGEGSEGLQQPQAAHLPEAEIQPTTAYTAETALPGPRGP
ncbi:hypothetical protein SEF58_03320 [Neomoorella humiferrea]